MALATEPGTEPGTDHDQLLWLAPSPLWEDGGIGSGDVGLERPRLVELTSDDFVAELVAFLAGTDPGGEGPAGLGNHGPRDGAGTADDPFVLYQPMHQRFYFVAGSLVCRRVGLPDRTVDPLGDRLSAVIRRLATRGEAQVEQAWLPAASGWVDAADPAALVPGEERFPLHAAPVTAPAATGAAARLLGLDEPGRRSVHFGYVPVAGRTARPPTLTDSGALAALAEPDSGAGEGDDPRLMAFRLRVTAAWADVTSKISIANELRRAEPSLYILLDLRDWLQTYLPAVLTALVDHTTLDGKPAREALRAHLDIDVDVSTDGGGSYSPRNLGTVLGELADFLPLLAGDPVAVPTTLYDVALRGTPEEVNNFFTFLSGSIASGPSDGGKVYDALVEEDADTTTGGAPARVPPELSGMIVARPADPALLDDRHVVRLVYEHEPCRPVVSEPSAVLRFAGVYDPDAPARKVRIQVPDPVNLRRFNRGIAIEMPPNLRKILDGVTPKLLKEEPLGEGGDWAIGMICSFSFQIFMVLSFIIAFIFLILLNIVFWWLPFIKICFPIPVKRTRGGP